MYERPKHEQKNKTVKDMQDYEIDILRELYYHKREFGTMVVPNLASFCTNVKIVCEELANKGLILFVANGCVHITPRGENFLWKEGIVKA